MAVVQEASFPYTTNVSGAATKPFTSSVTAGNLLLCVIVSDQNGNQDPSAITDSVGSTWAQAQVQFTPSVTRQNVWWAIAGGSGANTVAIATALASWSGIGFHIMEFAKLGSTGTALDLTALSANSGNGANVAPSFTGLAASNDLVLYWAGRSVGSNAATGGIWTDTATDVLTAGGFNYVQVSYAFTGPNVTGPTLAPGTNSGYNIIGVTFKPLGGTPVTGTGGIAFAGSGTATVSGGNASGTGAITFAGSGVATVPAGTGPWRLFPSTNGPTSALSHSGNFISAVGFTVTQGGCWFQGYWWWVCPSGGQLTGPAKCALWSQTSQGGGTVIPGSVVTSGNLSAGWNYIALPQPIPVAIGDCLVAAIACNGSFPDTSGFYAANPNIKNGPLMAWGPAGTSTYAGGNANPYNTPQGCFSTATNDPAAVFPGAASGTDNFWVDVQISATAPTGYSGTYRAWPNKAGADPSTSGDAPYPYIIGTEMDLSAPCTPTKVWYYSPGGAVSLATSADIWRINSGGVTGTNVVTNPAPTWLLPNGSAAAPAQGWMYCTMPATSLAAGNYRVSVYNSAGFSDQNWSAKRLGYWGTSPASVSNGAPAASLIAPTNLVHGPLTVPTTSNAQLTYSYQNEVSGTPVPTFTEPGQSVFQVGPPNAFPNIYVGVHSPDGTLYQNYWVDMEFTKDAIPVVNGTASVTLANVNIAVNGNVTVQGTASVALPALSIDTTGTPSSPIVGPTVTGTAHIIIGGIQAVPIRAALLSHFLDTYVVPDVKNWDVENERFRHDQALYRYGEYSIFVLMWTMQEFTAGLVARCSTCYTPMADIESTWQQPSYFKCPDCLGTSFEGGYKAILVRPSLWSWNEPTLQQTQRGVLDTNVATVQTTSDFRMQPRDYIIRGDGSRWQSQDVSGDHIDTGFGTQAGIWNASAFIYQNVSREDESSPIYLLPITETYIQDSIPQYYSRKPVEDF